MNIPDEYFKEGGWVKPINIDASVNRVAILVTQEGIDKGKTYFVDATVSELEILKNRGLKNIEALLIAKINNAKMSLSDMADSFTNPLFYNFKTDKWDKI